MQLNYSLTTSPAQPGQLYDMNQSGAEIRSYPAKVAIPFGVLCEINSDGTVQPVQDSTTGASFKPLLAGVSMFKASKEMPLPAVGALAAAGTVQYAVGEMVPCVRRGTVWVQFDFGGTWPVGGVVNVWHSSTGANPQGVFTLTAAQTTAGAEIDKAPPSMAGAYASLAGAYTDAWGNTQTMAVLDINLPGNLV